jgi:hypothetical protein
MVAQADALTHPVHGGPAAAGDSPRQAPGPAAVADTPADSHWREMAEALRALAPFDGALVLLMAGGRRVVFHAEGATADAQDWPPGGGWVVRPRPGVGRRWLVASPAPGTAHLLDVVLHEAAGTILSVRLLRDAGRPFLEHEAEAVERVAALLAGLAQCAERLHAAEAAARRERRLTESMLAVLD